MFVTPRSDVSWASSRRSYFLIGHTKRSYVHTCVAIGRYGAVSLFLTIQCELIVLPLINIKTDTAHYWGKLESSLISRLFRHQRVNSGPFDYRFNDKTQRQYYHIHKSYLDLLSKIVITNVYMCIVNTNVGKKFRQLKNRFLRKVTF